eukprot:294755_1
MSSLMLFTGCLLLAVISSAFAGTSKDCGPRLGTQSSSSQNDSGYNRPLAASGNGLGEQLDWVPWKQAQSQAKSLHKPIMLVVHRNNCYMSGQFRKDFTRYEKSINSLAKDFVVSNILDNEDTEPNTACENGRRYYPRVMFYDANGKLNKDVINEDGYPYYKYYYWSTQHLMNTMKRVMKQ